jgi:16S rRNA (cytosine967-C5)-methyltransferase
MNEIVVAAAGRAARSAAVRLLAGVLDRRQPLDALLDSEAAYRDLPERDGRLARAIVSTALRRHGEIGALLARLVERAPRRAGNFMHVLEIAAAQILFMDVADHAAVSIAVEEVAADPKVRHLKGLANAVLRRIARERDALPGPDAARANTPDWLWESWSSAYGEAAAHAIATAHLSEPALDLSVKEDAVGWADKLGGVAIGGTVRLNNAGPVDQLPGYAEGAWWVQDFAASIPPQLAGDVRGKRVADLCAAPGGKTAALAAAGAAVTAVDISESRLKRLAANLARLKLDAEIVAADVLAWQPPGPFDVVLLDAPCSATGTIRRHPDVQWLKQPEDVATLARLQARMIGRAAAMLKPGGLLIYCTCSLEPAEGEGQLAGALAGNGLTLAAISPEELPYLRSAVTPAGTVRTLPSQTIGEGTAAGLDGFFIMRLLKA